VAPATAAALDAQQAAATALPILLMLSTCHLLNDMIQSLLPAIYPLLKDSFALDFGQIGLITLTFQLTASLLQPFVGIYTDRHPMPYSLALGMGSTLCGLLLLSRADTFPMLLLAAALIGLESVTGVTFDAKRDGLIVQTLQARALAVAVARLAKQSSVRLLEVRPLDDSLESLFRELVR
jgi:MFS family permease